MQRHRGTHDWTHRHRGTEVQRRKGTQDTEILRDTQDTETPRTKTHRARHRHTGHRQDTQWR
eukprot:10314415-Alexandrium_andersonii.AAC.1